MGRLMDNKQRGVALIMVMVFLLIMTLISATAIQQNSLQFAMIGNAQEQSQAFTGAENTLRLAEQNIQQLRWSAARNADPTVLATATQCRAAVVAGTQLYALPPPGFDINLGIAGVTAVVQSWWCQNNPDMTLAAIDQDGDGVVDADDAGFGQPTTCTVAPCPIPTVGFTPFPALAPAGGFNTGCGTELYSIRVTLEQQNESQAERIVESKFAVQCLTVGL